MLRKSSVAVVVLALVVTTPEFAALKARLTDEIRAESIRAVELEGR